MRVSRNEHSVLIVDDSDAHRYAVARGLRACGYQTVEARSGAEGLELAAFAAAVVLDVNLPDVHGYEVCRILRSQEATCKLPIVHVSAMATGDQDRFLGADAGADGYMVAPLDPRELADTLDRLIAGRTNGQPGDRSGAGANSVLTQLTQREKLRNCGEDR